MCILAALTEVYVKNRKIDEADKTLKQVEELSDKSERALSILERARETLNTAQLLRDQNADTASIVNRAYYASSTPRLPSLRPLARKHRSTVAYWRCSTGVSSRRASCQKRWGNSCTPPLIRVKQGTTKTNLKSHGQWQNGWWNLLFSLSIPSRKNFKPKCDFCEGEFCP